MNKAKSKVGMIQAMGFYHACTQITSARCHLETGNCALHKWQSASGPGEALQAKSITLIQARDDKGMDTSSTVCIHDEKYYPPNPEGNENIHGFSH